MARLASGREHLACIRFSTAGVLSRLFEELCGQTSTLDWVHKRLCVTYSGLPVDRHQIALSLLGTGEHVARSYRQMPSDMACVIARCPVPRRLKWMSILRVPVKRNIKLSSGRKI
jgi:hypothetical protein